MRLLLLLCLCGCSGVRNVARPTTPAGYKSVALRDIFAVGIQSVNVEVVGVLGPMVPQEVCGGLVTFPLIEVSKGDGGVFSMETASVTLSVPRSRYQKLRELRAGDQVRARGYLSKWFAEGCDWFMRDASRYLWVDTIERL